MLSPLEPARAARLLATAALRAGTLRNLNCGTGAGGFQPGNTCAKGDESGTSLVSKAKKAPKAPPVPLESKKAAYDEVKKGGTFKATAAKYGMTQGQLSGYVWKVDQQKKNIEQALAQPAEPPAAEEASAAPKTWNDLSSDEKLSLAHTEGLTWKEKTSGVLKGQYAWFDATGTQVSAPEPDKGAYRQNLDTLHFGKGLEPPSPSIHGWPIGNDVPRAIGEKYPKVVENAAKPWIGRLDETEKFAIDYYTGSGYIDINTGLRTGKFASGYVEDKAKAISSALAKADPPPPPELVWRGISGSEPEFIKSLGIGDTIKMKGFQSTSIRPTFAISWSSSKTIMEIKPARGAYVRPISSHKQEYEYLLPHASKYTVKGISYVQFKEHASKVRVLQLEMHGDD